MKSIRQVTVLTLALVLCNPVAVADQTDQRLDGLFQILRDSQDGDELIEVEASIWEIWYQSGVAEIDTMMLQAGDLVDSGELAAAETIYASVIERAPTFSEGWNRRATVRFYRHDYDGSLQDIEQTLKLEPRHFGAIWGLGMILGLQHDYQRAISAFEKLLEIKPNARDARPRIELLKQELARQSV
jgi:tetratricopeptide (TPR) repeat protein